MRRRCPLDAATEYRDNTALANAQIRKYVNTQMRVVIASQTHINACKRAQNVSPMSLPRMNMDGGMARSSYFLLI